MTEQRIEWDGEDRSPHAIAVDRGIQAKEQHATFNQKYKGAPNRGDVVRYDDRVKGKTRIPPEKPRVEPKKRVSGVEYVPVGAEKQRLTKIFHRLPPVQQHKDLLTTRNVVRNKAQLARWEQNPRHGDVRGIDTQPESVSRGRAAVLAKQTGVPIEYATLGMGTGGQYASPIVGEGKGRIVLNRRFFNRDATIREGFGGKKVLQITVPHEFGHAYDRNVLGKTVNVTKGYFAGNVHRTIGNVTFAPMKKPKKALRGAVSPAAQQARNWAAVEKVTRTKINPYEGGSSRVSVDMFNPKTGERERKASTFTGYRQMNDELFADWFAGLVGEKSVVKKHTRGFYNIFRKSNKPLVSALRKSDLDATAPFIGGKHKKKGGRFVW